MKTKLLPMLTFLPLMLANSGDQKPLSVLDQFAEAVRNGQDPGTLGITPPLSQQQRADLLSVRGCKVNLGAASTKAKPLVYWVCGKGANAVGKVAKLGIEAEKIVTITVEPIVSKPTRARN